jgi:hypothetical protein
VGRVPVRVPPGAVNAQVSTINTVERSYDKGAEP